MLRGGSWNNNPRNCRSAYRNRNNRDKRNNNMGFRVVCMFPSTLQFVGTDKWEFIGCTEESRPIPVRLIRTSENKAWLNSLVS